MSAIDKLISRIEAGVKSRSKDIRFPLMEAQQISTKGTDTRFMEFDTVASDQFDTKSKNEKIIAFINGRKRSKRDSSESAKRPKEWQDYLNRMLNYEMWQESLTYIWRHYEEYERFRPC